MSFYRSRNAVLLAKQETTEGVDAAPTGTNAVKIENLKVTYGTTLIKTNEVSGSLDVSPQIIGGTKVTMTFDVYLKGNGAPGTTAPEWGVLLTACGWTQTLTAAAIGVPTAITAGTASQVTLPAAFSGANEAYRGMPLLLTGTVPTGFGGQSTILDFNSTSKIALLTDTASGAFTTSALAQIPPNALYTPGSSSIPSNTFYAYLDGLLIKMFGARGTFKISLPSEGPMKASFTFTGLFGGESDSSNPSPTYDVALKPIWKNAGGLVGGPGAFTINAVAIGVKTFNFDNGNTLVLPDDPNSNEGFDGGQITMRDLTCDVDPYQTTIATRDIMTDLRAGTARPIHVRLGATTGNRVSLTLPSALYIGGDPIDNGGLMARTLKCDVTGNDAAGAQLCVY